MRIICVALVAITTFVAIVIGSVPAQASDACDRASDDAEKQVSSTYDPKINTFLKLSAALKEKGFDPRKYPVARADGSVESVDLVAIVEAIGLQRAAAYSAIGNAKKDCKNAIEVPQKIVDIGVTFATIGLSKVLPEPVTRIDVVPILQGYPLGSDSALVPKARDELLQNLGIGGDVGAVIRDPKKIFGL